MAAELRGKVALVTGANRGIGLAVCRRLGVEGVRVVLGSRDPQRGEVAAQALRAEGFDVTACRLEVTDQESVDAAAAWLEATYGRLDVLVNNAGIMPNKASALEATLEDAEAMWQVNTLAPWRVCRAFVPLMLRGGWGRIVNVSSESGRFDRINAVATAYRVSKTALNAYTKSLAAELKPRGVLVNAVCPGWVASDMGGPTATGTLEEGGESIFWAIALDDSGPTGGFFQDGRPMPW
jgi:NAD(P)-dependent dehydrogenase (short-subunit alcohol dehydrogenase family)